MYIFVFVVFIDDEEKFEFGIDFVLLGYEILNI